MEGKTEGPGNVNTYLSVELAEDFVQVKQHYGIDTNADVVRFLIKKEARAIRQLAERLPEPVTT
jgi:hypothetical protein